MDSPDERVAAARQPRFSKWALRYLKLFLVFLVILMIPILVIQFMP
ncbi:MAG: hypothetical protein JWO05_968 [Gemmatimonadetes bacterium]|nr:hypothetical protein [Gemmatimonadota bacterium]